MKDRELSASVVMATILWILSVGLWLVGWLVGLAHLERLSLIICGAAVTATVRMYLVTLGRQIKAGLIVAAEQAQVRSLR